MNGGSILQVRTSMRLAVALVTLFLLQSASPLLHPDNSVPSQMEFEGGIEWVQFDLVDGVFSDAIGLDDHIPQLEARPELAVSRLGTFDAHGLELQRPVPSDWLLPRLDLSLIVVSNEVLMLDVRNAINAIPGLAIREFIAPSGLLIQGTPFALVHS